MLLALIASVGKRRRLVCPNLTGIEREVRRRLALKKSEVSKLMALKVNC